VLIHPLKQPITWHIFAGCGRVTTSTGSPTVILCTSKENKYIYVPHVNVKYHKYYTIFST